MTCNLQPQTVWLAPDYLCCTVEYIYIRILFDKRKVVNQF